MQCRRSRYADSGVDHDFPAVWQLDIDGLVQTNASDLPADCLDCIAQITDQIDAAYRMALAANRLQL